MLLHCGFSGFLVVGEVLRDRGKSSDQESVARQKIQKQRTSDYANA